MKLLHCADCRGTFSIGPFLGICPCGHCGAKQVQGTLHVVVTGPAWVYALRNTDLSIGHGKFWLIGKRHKQRKYIHRVDTINAISKKADEIGKGTQPLTRRKK